MTARDLRYEPAPGVRLTHPQWCKTAAIYQINVRQFTVEGTLRAAAEHLPRLAELGVAVVWLMPIHPIGAVNRKGSLGSPYAVQDYWDVSPELGTQEDLTAFVERAHSLQLRVILDWVANHTAWDNTLVAEHPEWYVRDWKGDFCPTPWWDWTDVIDLDFEQPALREHMIEAMKFWVRTADVDGFRCDAAGLVPTDFWDEARRQLDELKPVFLLAEWDARDLHVAAFDATYAWSWYDAVQAVAAGKADLEALRVYYAWNAKAYPRDCLRMTFVSNHDKNSWEGTEFDQFGAGLSAAVVLSVVGEGFPLVYSGQEAGNRRQLEFFERDPIEWAPHPNGELYRDLFALKKDSSVLWNGSWGAPMVEVTNTARRHVLSFVRRDEREQIFAVFNFAAEPARVGFGDGPHRGSYVEHFTGAAATFGPDTELDLEPWGYRVYRQTPRP